MQSALNEQVNAEMYSAYIYLSMSAYFTDQNLDGAAGWMRLQFQEEMAHAMKIYDFVLERGGKVVLGAIEKPPEQWNSPLAAFEAAFEHEQKVTAMIDDLVNLANSEKDHASANFLQWFVDEQVEEEASVDQIVKKLKMVESAPGGLYMIDKELGQRRAN